VCAPLIDRILPVGNAGVDIRVVIGHFETGWLLWIF
jgi:hypothetical protein